MAQRRRRIFVIASARDGFNPAEVLFECEGVRWDTPPSRETREEVTSFASSGFASYREGVGTLRSCGNDYGGGDETLVAKPLNAHSGPHGRINAGDETFIVSTLDANYGKLQGCSGQDLNHSHSQLIVHGTQDPIVSDKALPIGRNGGQENILAEPHTLAIRGRDGIPQLESRQDGTANAILTPNGGRGGIGVGAIAYGMTVRRLTPVECERLQGFPDNHTLIPWRIYQEAKRKGLSYEGLLNERGLKLREPAGEDCPDGPRYKAIGNSKAVPVIQWIGGRIANAIG